MQKTNRRKRLYYQSSHRGMRELDILLGGFAVRHLAALSDAQLDLYEKLLEEPEVALYDWLTRRVPCPPPYRDIIVLIGQSA
jgi:antitoxin CptB